MWELLGGWYLWLKAFHIMSVIAWMAGLFYLPRLFVYHVERSGDFGAHALFLSMEGKLLRVIMVPAMISSWVFGILLASIPGVIVWAAVWPWTKLAGIIAMTVFHFWLAHQHRAFEQGRNSLSGRHYRMMNEVPTVLMVLIVLAVVIKF